MEINSDVNQFNESPIVCVCVPTYNAAKTVRETLESILDQTYPNLVVHVSDNASTDNTLEVIESFTDSRVIVHKHDVNVGGEENFTRCIHLANGKYTAIFHADDVYEPDMVAKQVAFLEANPGAGAVFTEAVLIDELGNELGKKRLPQGIVSLGGLYGFEIMFKALLRHYNFFICPSFMVRTSIYQQEICAWRGDKFGTSADLDVWLRILERHFIGHLPESLMRYRVSSSQGSAHVRKETSQGAFFSVVDYYLQKKHVKDIVNNQDLRNYEQLCRRDKVMRAINLYLTDKPEESSMLLRDALVWDTIVYAFVTVRGLWVLLVVFYLRILILLKLEKIGKSSLVLMKNVMRI